MTDTQPGTQPGDETDDESVAVSAYSRFFQVKVHFTGTKTTVELDTHTKVVVTGSADHHTPHSVPCYAAIDLAPRIANLPSPSVYFADIDRARRTVPHNQDLWLPPRQLPEPQLCSYQLVRPGTTVPVPAGAPAHLVNLDDIMHLAVYWYEVREEAQR